jgi:hypothetical protein
MITGEMGIKRREERDFVGVIYVIAAGNHTNIKKGSSSRCPCILERRGGGGRG